MKYLSMLFHAPLQSWGSENLPEVNAKSPRRTYTIPTKSGVLGLLRSSLGVTRDQQEDILHLKESRLLVRVDRDGKIARDYQIAQRTHHGFNAGTTREIPKDYLEDATFVVMFGHDDEQTLQTVAQSVQNPEWAPFFGRRAHVPSLPIYLGITTTEDPVTFLKEAPHFWGVDELKKLLHATDEFQKLTKKAKVFDSLLDTATPRGQTSMADEPIKFNPKYRQYSDRSIQRYEYEASELKPNLKYGFKWELQSLNQYRALKEHFNNDTSQ